MNCITFREIAIENFLSIGSNAVVINFNNQINVITGKNYDKEDSKNGVGKSTIVDAVHFALYGSTIREITKEQIVNVSTGKNCKVTLSFTATSQNTNDNYCITRTISPTKCTITKNGVNVTLSTIAKTTEFIQNLLKCSSKVFQNSVVMSINNTIPFLAQSKVDKRKYIENMFQLEIFSQMLLKARDDYNEIKHSYDIIRVKHLNNSTNLEAYQQQLVVFEDENKKCITELEEQKAIKLQQIATLNRVLDTQKLKILDNIDYADDLKKLIETHKKLNVNISDLKEKRVTILTEKDLLKRQLKQFADNTKPCPTCNRPFGEKSHNHEDVVVELQNKIDTFVTQPLDDKLTTLNVKLTNINKTIENCRQKEKEQLNTHLKHQNELTQITSKIEHINESINNIETSIKNRESKTNNSIIDLIAKAQEQFLQSEIEIKDNESQLQVLDCVKHILSEEGVKTFLIKRVLKVLNQKIQQYLSALQAPVKCEFDEFFDEKIYDEKNNERSYFNFSGGERKRIDLACLFAFMDMKRLQGESIFSTTFYDELLDSSLDSVGVDLVLDVLRDRHKKFNEGCYLITHRGSHILDKVDNIINLEKRNGFTYILK